MVGYGACQRDSHRFWVRSRQPDGKPTETMDATGVGPWFGAVMRGPRSMNPVVADTNTRRADLDGWLAAEIAFILRRAEVRRSRVLALMSRRASRREMLRCPPDQSRSDQSVRRLVES